ncbi:GATA zinc finger domain-containing protein 1 [Bulinus truncatus]|nr:GATA zinc finger domain-containing protein 1 [Bulinus truncatus]
MEPGKGVYIGYVPSYNNGYYNILVYDDEKSLTEKVNYIKKNGFSGVVLRSLNYDDYMSHCVPKFFPLLAAITDKCRFKMPFGIKPICSSCKITSSPIWRKGLRGEVFCNSCGLKQLSGQYVGNNLNSKTDIVAIGITNGSAKASNGSSAASGSNNNVPVLRKSLRIKPAKKTAQSSNKNVSTKGKGRRIIFKKNQPLKAPAAVATVITGECVFHKDQYYQVGDVVSLVDHDGGLYYAQLRGFLSDQYNEKSAVITWLLPTTNSPPNRFDPNTYILGPEEELPRKLEFMEFVCHAPSDYFRAKDAPYKTVDPEPKLCYIWTSIGPKITTVPSIDEIFGTSDSNSLDGSSLKIKMERDKPRDTTGLKEKDKLEKRTIKVESNDE